jgi:hypothetical protein
MLVGPAGIAAVSGVRLQHYPQEAKIRSISGVQTGKNLIEFRSVPLCKYPQKRFINMI